MNGYDAWRTRCVEHEWDDMENRVSKVYAVWNGNKAREQ